MYWERLPISSTIDPLWYHVTVTGGLDSKLHSNVTSCPRRTCTRPEVERTSGESKQTLKNYRSARKPVWSRYTRYNRYKIRVCMNSIGVNGRGLCPEQFVNMLNVPFLGCRLLQASNTTPNNHVLFTSCMRCATVCHMQFTFKSSDSFRLGHGFRNPWLGPPGPCHYDLGVCFKSSLLCFN